MPVDEGLIFAGELATKRTARVRVTLNGAPVFMDEANIFSDKARKAFAETIAEKVPALTVEAAQAELLKLADQLSRKPAADAPGGGDAVGNVEDDPAAREQAEAMLRHPELMQMVLDDIAKMGVAGEREAASLVYLTGISRLLPRPLALIVQGASSSGKSYLVEKTAELFPSEAKIVASSMTPQALIHLEPGALVRKFVVAGERSRKEDDDRAEATRALREMLSSGKLSKLMPAKGPSGNIATQRIEQEGPISYVESTTLTSIFGEDANRCILVQTDDGQEQTDRIIEATARTYEGRGTSPDVRAAIIRKHHALQRMLDPAPVVIPFASAIGKRFGVRAVEARRAINHLCSLIQAVALLHQWQRERDEEGRIIASLADYAIARQLMLEPLARTQGQVSDKAKRFLEEICKRIDKGKTFTTADAKRWELSSKHSVHGWLCELQEAAALELVEEHRGRKPAVWNLKATKLRDLAGKLLPTADELAEVIANEGNHQAEADEEPDRPANENHQQARPGAGVNGDDLAEAIIEELQAADGWLFEADITQALNRPPETIRKVLWHLCQDDRIIRCGNRYAMPGTEKEEEIDPANPFQGRITGTSRRL